MTARLLLVGIVAGFGIDFPSVGNHSWTQAVQSWADTRCEEFKLRNSETASPVETEDDADDLAFATLMEEIVREIESTPAASPVEVEEVASEECPSESPGLALPLLGSEEALVIEQPEVAIMAELPAELFATETLASTEEVLALPDCVWAEPLEPAVEEVLVEAKPIERSPELIRAIRLTGEAFHAWMSLIVVNRASQE
jgi:hypothetical protein